MKIYQIYESSEIGISDYIVGSYISHDKAKSECKRLEQEDEIKRRCNYCPLFYCDNDCDEDCERCEKELPEKVKKYCDKYLPLDTSNKCENVHFHDDKYYSIKEVEVVE